VRIPWFPYFFQIAASLALLAPVTAQTLYDFGNPTAEEQLYLELINRARANPTAEGVRLAATTDPDILAAYSYYSVDLRLMQREFEKIAAAPPLAPNANLTSAARGHTVWMFNTATQAHNETNPSNTPYSRITASGYNYTVAGENIYAYSKSVDYGHAGFEVDWGTGTGGMQTGRGHRVNIHSPNYREIGVGVVLGTNGSVGPQLVTQDFGTRFGSPALGTGVAYYDLNANNFYDIGEGIAGLTVNVSGASYYCTSAAGGGWTVPVPAVAANRTVTFSGLGMNQSIGLAVSGDVNAKADLKLAYSPPVITSTADVSAGVAHTLQFTQVGGAASYKCSLTGAVPAPAENCETETGITKSITGGYQVLQTAVKKEGTSAFHLMNYTPSSQWIELKTLFSGGTAPSLSFQSRVGAATTSERFKVQVREEGGSAWQTVYEQAGTNGWGESSFSLRSASLSAMSGKQFRVRFLLDYTTGSYFPNTTSEFGWYVDAINFTDVSKLDAISSAIVATPSWTFTPSAGSYKVTVIPVISGKDFPGVSQNIVAVAVTQSPPSFSTWAAALESNNGLPAGTLSNANGDHDKDGRCNLIEYAFGGSPVGGNDPPERLPVTSATATQFILRYQVDTSLGDLIVTPQTCPTMSSWKKPGDAGAPVGFTDQLISTNGNIQTREASIPLSSGKCFLRLGVTRQ
jgi:uncharacterized protein YkwD